MEFKDVLIREASFETEKEGEQGKIAIFTYIGEGDPISRLQYVVSEYVKNKGYNQFVDINGDNPWTRVICSNLDLIKTETFNSDIHSL